MKSSFHPGIQDVAALGPQEQLRRICAFLVVALMEDAQLAGIAAVVKPPCQTVS
jgi:hypothetical protein